ncbi:DUF3889 domain-containing protein [Bacillus pumilus]|uniref:DUF3889 domain-containing protein n=1 Tax=Bacillus pumilus TaxID=1408 RepID=UPI0024C172D9|nr:DUF3889 domain-containing protein [Bacillus pumilus]WHX46866.1 DUF3889 domain-containing protein [Bacillus pumilus]
MLQDANPADARGFTSAVDHWEIRAVKEAKKRYPLTQVLFKQKVWDRHREKESVKQYHITLKDHTKEFGVFVTISYNPYSNKVNKVIVVEEYS